jgi:dolichol-phosphate mannosyltransferase
VLTFLNVNYNISAVVAFLVAVTQNYQLNKKWTFRDHNTKTRKKFPKYIALNFFSFLVNIAVLNLVVINFGDEKLVQIAGQILGIATAMGFNFFGSYLIIFAKHKESEI